MGQFTARSCMSLTTRSCVASARITAPTRPSTSLARVRATRTRPSKSLARIRTNIHPSKPLTEPERRREDLDHFGPNHVGEGAADKGFHAVPVGIGRRGLLAQWDASNQRSTRCQSRNRRHTSIAYRNAEAKRGVAAFVVTVRQAANRGGHGRAPGCNYRGGVSPGQRVESPSKLDKQHHTTAAAASPTVHVDGRAGSASHLNKGVAHDGKGHHHRRIGSGGERHSHSRRLRRSLTDRRRRTGEQNRAGIGQAGAQRCRAVAHGAGPVARALAAHAVHAEEIETALGRGGARRCAVNAGWDRGALVRGCNRWLGQ